MSNRMYEIEHVARLAMGDWQAGAIADPVAGFKLPSIRSFMVGAVGLVALAILVI